MIEEGGQRVLPRFRKAAVSDVSDPKLLEVLRFVCDYWKDNFRPAFASLWCGAVGGRAEAADGVSLMVTLTSAGGGIHDDIIDKSSNKHFRMTVLGKYGLDCALLVGDLLIQKGWMMARNLFEENSQKDKLAEIIEVYGGWTIDVCEAEFMEVQFRQNLETELDQYENMLFKSMADTQACARLGAIIGGGSRSEIQASAEFGSQLGFMYRLADDLKDTLNVEYNLSNRLRYESVPLPILYAAKNSKEKKPILENIVAKSSLDTLDFKQILDACIQTETFDYIEKRAKETVRKALKKLESLRDSRPKRALAFMIEDSLVAIRKLSKQAALDYQHGFDS